MSTETFRYDTADYLDTEEAIADFAQEVVRNEDPALMEHAVGVIIRAHGLITLASTTGLSRDRLIDALSGHDPAGRETLRAALRAIARATGKEAA